MELLPQTFCSINMASFWSKHFWPLSSPNLNPLIISGGVPLRVKLVTPLDMAIWTHFRSQSPGNGMIFPKRISGGLAPLSEAVSSHVLQQMENTSSKNVQNAYIMCSPKFQTEIPENTKVILN